MQVSETQHTCILGEEDVLALQVGMHHLIAVKEHKPPNDIQSHQVTLPAFPTAQLQQGQPASKFSGANDEKGGIQLSEEAQHWSRHTNCIIRVSYAVM